MISIVTVCFNEEKGIDPTLSSICSQTYRDYEVIVKDGGSSDSTVSKAEKWRERFEEKGAGFKLVSGADKGIYDGMNLGVKEASGEFVCFMNAGDSFFSPDVLEKIFNDNDYDGVDLIYGDAAEEEFGELHYFRKCPELIESRMPFCHQSVFVRRSLLIEYPFDLNFRIAADYDFLLKLHDRGSVFMDSGVLTAKIGKTGTSSLRLKDTYLESLRLRRSHGIKVPEGCELKRKLIWLDIKQFGMDHFPDGLKYVIRKVQRRLRGQKRV